MQNLYEINHPLVKHHLARLRDKKTPPAEFRGAIRCLTTLLAYEATKDLETTEIPVQTPLATTTGECLKYRIALVPILRAGLGMVDPVIDLIPDVEVWHLGFYRDEQTFQPIEYYKKLPPGRPTEIAMVVDPMLATGGSCVAALDSLTQWGVKRTKLLAVIAAPEGIKRINEAFPDTQVYVCAIDHRLNEQAYIVPGLGDAGDRIFNAIAH